MPIGWMLEAYRFFEWCFKEGEDVLEIRAAMRRLGLDPNDEEQIRKYFEEHSEIRWSCLAVIHFMLTASFIYPCRRMSGADILEKDEECTCLAALLDLDSTPTPSFTPS